MAIDFNARLDSKIDNAIQLLLKSATKCNFHITDLDKKVNEEETLREYLVESEKFFGLPHKASFSSDKELCIYVDYIDNLWRE